MTDSEYLGRYIPCGRCGAEIQARQLIDKGCCLVCKNPIHVNLAGRVRICHKDACNRTAGSAHRGSYCRTCEADRRARRARSALQPKCKGCGSCLPFDSQDEYHDKCRPVEPSDLVLVRRNLKGEAWVPLEEYLRVLQLAKDAGLEV